MVGQTISHYRIIEKLGEGGMGVVYKAVDTNLDRTVALKFLPIDSEHPEARERFLREAKAAAALDHPSVCAVHEFGESGGRPFLALGFVDGGSLSDRVRERPFKIEDALDIAIQVGEGLRAAHEKGIVHRDIKCTNILLTSQGKAKIADFGLAHLADRSRLTRTRASVGTPAYMSPEQVQGLLVDRRTDIWSLGVVLYVMTTGRLPFNGDRDEAMLYAIANQDHEPITGVRVGVPAELDRIVGKALAKNREDRYQHIDDMIVDMSALKRALSSGQLPAHAQTSAPRRSLKMSVLYGALAAISIFAAAISILYFRAPSGAAVDTPVRRFRFTPESFAPDGAVAISPDGKHVVYVTASGLSIRDMHVEEPRSLAGTEGASDPFWSPDSAFVGFIAGGQVKKVPTTGGVVTTICPQPQRTTKVAWMPSGDSLLLAQSSTDLALVSAWGGIPNPIMSQGGSGYSIRRLTPLPLDPGSPVVLASLGPGDEPKIVTIDLKTGKTRILTDGTNAEYSPAGYILYQRGVNQSGIWALPFSLKDFRQEGEPFRVVDSGGAPTVSREGTLVFVDALGTQHHQLVWRNRKGTRLGTLGEAQPEMQWPVLSPDGGRVAVTHSATGSRAIWVMDVRHGIGSRLTFTPGPVQYPHWSPGGKEIVFAAIAARTWDVHVRAADGSRESEPLTATPEKSEWATDWSSDGNHVMLTVAGRKFDLHYLKRPAEGARFEAVTLLATDFNERIARFSPDGKYYAYCSDEAGREEVYVRKFPSGESKVRVSHNGGCLPQFSLSGGELFFLERDTLMATTVVVGSAFSAGTPQALFRSSGLSQTGVMALYAATADGRRFLIAEPVANDQSRRTPSIHIVQNWFADFTKPAR